MEVVEVLPNFCFGSIGPLILHAGQCVADITITSESLLDEIHGDLLFGLAAVEDEADAVLMELDDSFHHAHGLMHRAVVVML